MRVGITYNLKTEVELLDPSHPRIEDMYEEFDSPETIEAICKVLEGMGHECVRLGYGRAASEKLIGARVDFVFNIAEGYYGRSREAHMPALLEMLEIRYSGPGPLAAALTLDKINAKRVAVGSGVDTPSFLVLSNNAQPDLNGVKYPVILKLAYEGSSIGLRKDSKVRDEESLKKKVAWLQANYPKQPIIAERFIGGREFTVGVIGNNDPEILGIMEIIPMDEKLSEFIYSLEVKRNYLEKVRYECPPKISDSLRDRLGKAALQLYAAFGCRDVSRFDFRIDEHGSPYFLECNALPGLHPVSSDIVIMARLKGIEYPQLIERIFKQALERYN